LPTITPSVISSSRREGAIAVSASTRDTVSTSFPSSCRADTLMHILMGLSPASCRPGLSAGGLQYPHADRLNEPGLFGERYELPGATQPSSGLFQRSSASTELISPLANPTCG